MRIMIVDDEVIIREWLQFIIEKNPEWELFGCAENGRQAMEMLKTGHIDVIFTDIRMPVMDGLTLLRQVKQRYPGTIVVLLTAFSEFELARQALKEGADDYLLKTEVSNAALPGLLDRLKERILKGQSETEKARQISQESTYRYTMIRDILKSKRRLSEQELEKLREYHMDWREEGLFAAALFKRQMKDKAAFPGLKEIHHVTGLLQEGDAYVLIGNLSGELSEKEKYETLFSYASRLGEENSCMVGISRIHSKKADVSFAVMEAVHSLSIGFCEEKAKVYEPELAGEELLAKCTAWRRLLSAWYKSYCGMNGREKLEFLRGLESSCRGEKIYYAEYLKNLFMKILDDMALLQPPEEEGAAHASFELLKRQVTEADSLGECHKLLLETASVHIWSPGPEGRELSRNIAVAVDYIKKNYYKPISLEETAEVVGLNPEYLSRIFKEETGCTYSTFLAGIRLKQAACLLEQTNEKVQRIAQQVGYPNVSYFSTVFKKRYACNPYEYRRNMSKKQK